MKKKKIVIVAALAVVLVTLLVALIVSTAKRKTTIKHLNQELTELQIVADSLADECQYLGAMDVIRINVNFNLNQKNIASINFGNYKNIAKEVATITRRELLDSLKYNPIDNELSGTQTSGELR